MTDTTDEVARLRERVAILEGRVRDGVTGRPVGWLVGMTAASVVTLGLPYLHDYSETSEPVTTPRELTLLTTISRNLRGTHDFPTSARIAALLFLAAAALSVVVLSVASSPAAGVLTGLVSALGALVTVVALFSARSSEGSDLLTAPATGMFSDLLLLFGWCAAGAAYASWAGRVKAAAA